MPAKPKDTAAPAGVLTMRPGSGLPSWDDAAVLQENWGGPLALPVRAHSAVVDLRGTEGHVVLSPDTDERDAFAQCIASVAGRPVEMEWRRPTAIIAPFRPMVHCNATPFLFPYAEDPRPFDARAEEVSAQTGPPVSGKKSDARAAVAPPAPLHVQFPEVVRVLQPRALGARDEEERDGPSVVAEYRALQPLTQPYDATLEHGCAETPAVACGSRYSTALRHRLREVDRMTRLSEPPPFVMSAFNSAVYAIAYAQGLVRPGEYLWELIYPHAPGTQHPVYNPNGKYVVRLYIDGAFRRVTVDDYLPVDALGRPFLSITAEKEIWPAILAKAIFKALGPTAQHQLFTDPEAVVACLMGGWIPQYIDPRRDAAAACRALFFHQRHLQPPAAPCEEPTDIATGAAAVHSRSVGSRNSLGSPLLGQSVNEAAPSLTDAATENASTAAEVFQEQLPFAPPALFVCGVAGNGTQRQLYAIREIAPLQNTLALRVSTDPVVNSILEAQVLADNIDIIDGEKQWAPDERDPKSSANENDLCVWVTLEELVACVALVAFIPLGETCALRHSMRFAVGDEVAPGGSAGGNRKHHGASVASSHLAADTRRDAVRWIHIKCERVEQIAFVSIGSAVPPPVTVAPSGPPGGSSRPVSSRSVNTGSPIPPPPTFAPKPLPPSVANKVAMDLYTWSRGDPFSHAGVFAYETGRLSCNIYTVPAGSHILRVTATGLEPHFAVVLLSTCEFSVGDERDALRDAGVFRMSDAGIHDGITRAGEEVVWFKRRISVKEPTIASFIVVSLDHTEDLAAHRDVPALLVKETKTTHSRGSGAKGVTAAAKRGSIDDLPDAPCGIPIIQHCTLALMDLDTGAVRTGAIGRLVKQVLEPNHNGYLIIAYAVITDEDTGTVSPTTETAAALASVSEGGGSGRVSDTVPAAASATHETPSQSGKVVPSEESTIAGPKDNSAVCPSVESPMLGSPLMPVCGRGLWKLTVSADRSLDSYRAVPHTLSSFEEQGQLRRGSRALLFAYTCTITEQTCLTLQLDLYAHDAMPFTIKIFRGSIGSAEATAAAATAPVYVSAQCTGHLFVPHVVLDFVEKARSATYTVEAWLDSARVAAWEAQRRCAQALNFRSVRATAESAAEARRAADLAAYALDPRGFAERLEQSVAALAESAESLAWREPSGATAKKLRGSAGGNDRRQRGQVGSSATRTPRRESLTRVATDLPVPAPLLLDATDAALAVRFAVRMDFSARADVRVAAPAPTAAARDPLVALRAAFALGDDATVSSRASGASPGASSVGIGTAQRRDRGAKDLPDDAQRGERGRASRQRFLDNPRGVLFPYLMPDDDTASGSGSTAPRGIVMDVSDEPLSQHAAVLDPAAFRISRAETRAPLPPQPSVTQVATVAQPIVPPVGTQRATSGSVVSSAQRAKSPGERQALRGGSAAAPSLSPTPAGGDEDADGAEMRAPAAALALRLAEELRCEHERRSAGREGLKGAIRDYWATRAPESTLASLLALYEEDANKQRKNRSRV